MTIRDLFQETSTALSANKVRSGLTVLGIVIGIASVIAMVAIGNGAQASITGSIESLGSNLLIVTPGSTRSGGVSAGRGTAKTLTEADASAIAVRVQNVTAVAPELGSRSQVVSSQANTNTTVTGTVPAYTQVRNLEIAEGAFLSDQQNVARAKVAVIGPTAASDLFPDGSDPLGQTVRINGTVFTIIGETVAKGGTGFQNPDDAIYIPLKTAEQYIAGTQYLSDINIQAASADSMAQVQQDATDLLLELHHISDPANPDFSIVNQADILSTVSSITGTFTLFLSAIAGISLLVGGIGIMNMMLTNVTERTREIGLRKAIGAAERDISNQFLLESISLTLIGGVVGVALGWLVAIGISLTGAVHAVVTLSSILLAFGVSAAIGIVFGWYPARRAARLNPIDALRYE